MLGVERCLSRTGPLADVAVLSVAVPIPVNAGRPVSVHATLPVEAFDQVPELHRIDFFFSGHVEVGAFQHGVQGQVSPEPDVLAEWRDDLFDSRDQLVPVAEVVQHDDAATGFTYPDHFVHDFTVVRDGGHDISRHDGVEGIVGEFHFSRVHQHEPNMVQMVM